MSLKEDWEDKFQRFALVVLNWQFSETEQCKKTNSISQKKGKKKKTTRTINRPCSNQVILHIIRSFMRPPDIKHCRSQFSKTEEVTSATSELIQLI